MRDRVVLVDAEKIIAGTMLAKKTNEVSYEEFEEIKKHIYKRYNEKGETAVSFFGEKYFNEINRKYNFPFHFGEDTVFLNPGVTEQFLLKKILIYCPDEVLSWIKEKTAKVTEKTKWKCCKTTLFLCTNIFKD